MFLIVGRDAPSIRFSFSLAYDLGLNLGCLDFFFHFVVRCAHEEFVCPALVGDANFHLCEGGEVVVVEASTVCLDILPALLVPNFDATHHVVVLRIVDADGRADGKSVLQYILSAEVAPMGMEGADAVACIEIVHLLAVGDDVHGTSQCIAAEPRRHNALVDLYMVDEVDGQICQRHARAFCVQRHAVNEVADGIARHAVDAQVEVRAHTAFFANLHTSRAVHQCAQGTDGADHRAYVDSIHRQRTFAQPLNLRLSRDGDTTKHYGVNGQGRCLLHIVLCKEQQRTAEYYNI